MRKKHRHNRQVVGMFTLLRQRISPPFRILRELFHRVFPLRSILRLSEFQIRSRYNPRSPNSIANFVCFQTNLGILPHSLNLLTQTKRHDAVGLIRKGDWHDTRLVIREWTGVIEGP